MVHSYDARVGAEGPAVTPNRGELIFYDSVTAKRTILGRCCHLDCCLPPVYKITSERVMFVEWDVWHPFDSPISSCLSLPYFLARSLIGDCCCGVGASNSENAAAQMKRRSEDKEKNKGRNCLNRACAIPVGRTANFTDIDLMMDVGAHQNLVQLVTNEGDLILHMMPGDASTAAEEGAGAGSYALRVKDVPEVFSLFDDFSYDLSNLNLTHFRQNAVAQTIMQR